MILKLKSALQKARELICELRGHNDEREWMGPQVFAGLPGTHWMRFKCRRCQRQYYVSGDEPDA